MPCKSIQTNNGPEKYHPAAPGAAAPGCTPHCENNDNGCAACVKWRGFAVGSRCGFTVVLRCAFAVVSHKFAVLSHRFAVVSHSFAVVSRWFRSGFAQIRTVSRWFRMLRSLRGCFRIKIHIKFTRFTAVSHSFTLVAHGVTA